MDFALVAVNRGQLLIWQLHRNTSGKESGADLRSAYIANIDVDAESELLDVLTLDGQAEPGGMTQPEIHAQIEALRDQFLNAAYRTTIEDNL